MSYHVLHTLAVLKTPVTKLPNLAVLWMGLKLLYMEDLVVNIFTNFSLYIKQSLEGPR